MIWFLTLVVFVGRKNLARKALVNSSQVVMQPDSKDATKPSLYPSMRNGISAGESRHWRLHLTLAYHTPLKIPRGVDLGLPKEFRQTEIATPWK